VRRIYLAKKGLADFTWHSARLLKPIGDVRFNQGTLTARIDNLVETLKKELVNLNNTRHASWGFDLKCAPRWVTYFYGMYEISPPSIDE